MIRAARKSNTYQMEEYGWLSSGRLGEHHGANPSQSRRIGGLPEQVWVGTKVHAEAGVRVVFTVWRVKEKVGPVLT